MHLEIVWDDDNLVKATRRASVTEITQAIFDAATYTKGRTDHSDRAILVGNTHGGRRLRVIVEVRDPVTIRPITAWEENR